MQFVNNNIKIRPTTPDGILSPGQIESMVEDIAKKYNWLQFDILEVTEVIPTVNGVDYGGIKGRLLTTQHNKSVQDKVISPFSLRDFELPEHKELVMVFEYLKPGDSPDEATLYYIRNFTVNNSLNFNIGNAGVSGVANENEFAMRERNANTIIEKNIPLPTYKSGDRFIHGRYGHYIQFTNRDNSPCMRITNGVDEFNEGGLFNPYFNNEGSVIYLDKTPENNPLDLDRRVKLEGTDFPKLTGNQIVIESDRLIFQSKKEEVFITAAKKLDITAPEVFINGQAHIHGDVLKDTLEELKEEINSISTWAMTMGYLPGKKPPHPALGFLRTLMKNIFNPRKKGSPWDTPKAKLPEPKKDKLTYGETKKETTTLIDDYKIKPQPLAFVMKVNGEGLINDKLAKRGDPIYDGDEARTEEGAFMVVIHKDDKSVTKIRENIAFHFNKPTNKGDSIISWGESLHTDPNGRTYRLQTSVSVASVKG